jgi:hypothetical protein
MSSVVKADRLRCRFNHRRRWSDGVQAPALMIFDRSLVEKRKCFPMKVHGIARAVAFLRSHDGLTCKSAAAWSAV